MHSSTSSFRPLPRGWLSITFGVVLAAALLAGWELFWRSRGFVPSLTNNETLWCHARATVDKDAVVIVGSSRLETGIEPQRLSQILGGRHVVQLGLDGGNPIPALLDLGRDSAFGGTVIFEYMPRRLLTPDSMSYARTQTFVGACANPSLLVGVEATMDRALEKHLAFLNFEIEPVAILSHAARRKSLPRNSHAILRDDRYLALYFHGHGRSAEKVWEPLLSTSELDARMRELREAIANIRARGGKVVLYRPPVTDGVLEDEEGRYPAAKWLPTVAQMLDVPAIDFQDIPEIRALVPPDGEHLEAADAPLATDAFGRRLLKLLAN